MILARVFSKANGFFVDVGAHHPFRFSNTYHFYRMGWSGINIDANAEHVALFREKRPRDINVHSGVGESEAELEYFEFDDPALNTFSKDRAAFLRQTTEYTVVGVKKVPVRTLAAILDSELPRGQEIDFLSVDVEGLDLAVLRSNNWQKYRPRIILVEELDFPGFKNLGSSSLAKYLGQFGYELFAKSKNTLFFKIPDES